MNLELRSALFRDYFVSPRIQQHALLHLVHPDTFEPIVSAVGKDKIAAAFEELLEDPVAKMLTANSNRSAPLWNVPTEPSRSSSIARLFGASGMTPTNPDDQTDDELGAWDEFIRSAREFVDTGQIDSVENDYKIQIGQRVAEAREAVLTKSWSDLVKSNLSKNNNLIHPIQLAKLRDWIDDAPDESLRAFMALWVDGDSSSSERVQAFMRGCFLDQQSAL